MVTRFIVISCLVFLCLPFQQVFAWDEDCAVAQKEAPDTTVWGRFAAAKKKVIDEYEGRPNSAQVFHYLNDNRPQEAIWLLNDAKADALSEQLERATRCYLLLGEIIDSQPQGGGKTLTRKVAYKNGLEAILKPEQKHLSANPYSEASTYIISKALRLKNSVVPITVLRDGGSVQIFIRDAIAANKEKEPKVFELSPEERAKPAEMWILDRIIKNPDRDAKNYLYLRNLKKTIAIDHGWAMRGKEFLAGIKARIIDKRTKAEKEFDLPPEAWPSAELMDQLKTLDMPALVTELQKSKLPDDAIAKMRRHFNVMMLVLTHAPPHS